MNSQNLLMFFISAIMATFGLTENCCKNYNYTYQLSNDLQNWHQALINCASVGMRLAAINSREDSDNLYKYLSKNTNTAHIYYWLSGTNLGNGNWYWATNGQMPIYTNWRPGEPNDLNGTQHCMSAALINASLGVQWDDVICEDQKLYICEREPCCNQTTAGDTKHTNNN